MNIKKEHIKRFLAAFLVFVFAVVLSSCEKKEEEFKEHAVSVSYNTYDNTKIGWGLKKKENSAPEMPENITSTLKKHGGFYLSDKGEKNLYLTFDEGYENGYSAKILDVLKETKTPAAFFVTGDYIKNEPELVKRMHDEGHIVGNHTNHHPSMPDKTDNEIIEEITSLNKMYNELTGDNMKYLRPPMGEYSERTLAITNELGYKTVMWSFAYVDWKRDEVRGADYAYSQIMPYLHDGAVLLLHAVSKDNADVLKRFIEDARKAGYTFKSLDEI